MGKPSICLVLCVLAACGDDPEEYGNPPGSVDGGIDASIDAAIDAALDAPIDAALPVDAAGDGAPPRITIIGPLPGSLIAGVMRLEIKVTDLDGVASVTATISGQSITMDLTAGTETWVGLFDTAPLAGLVSPTIVVRAIDNVGDEAQIGYGITLDNSPPLSSLDPARVRQVVFDAGDQVCSRDFDPLGPDAPDDGESVPQLIELRARVTDLSNTGTLNSTLYVPNAGIESVELFVFDDTTKPLIVDSDADGICDDINPNLVPTITPMASNEAAVIELAGVVAGGRAYFNSDTLGGDNAFDCALGNDDQPPTAMCFGEIAMSVAIGTSFVGDPQIYGIPPIDEANCLGYAFDASAANVSDGWACAATLTIDRLGNRSVSEPLRICIDKDGDQAECASWGTIASAGSRPDCTGTVTAGNVTATPCTPNRYFRSATPDEFELIFP